MKKTISVLIVLGCFISTNIAFAQKNENKGVGISPLTFELTANPGDTIGNKVKITNPSNRAISVKMEVEDFLPVGEEGRVVTTTGEDEDTTYSLRRWITVVPSEFTLEKGKQKQVNFIIEVPKNAEPGGKYGSILAGVSGSMGESASGASVATKTGVLVLLMIAGDIKEELVVKDFSAPSFQEYGPVPFEIRFENKGTVHAKPKGFIVITDMFGKKVAELGFSQKNVLPGAIRKVDAKWDTKWLFGKYMATVIGSYGTSNIPFEPRVITFSVFPWKLMLGVLIAFIIVITFLFKTRKRWQMALKILFKGEHHYKI